MKTDSNTAHTPAKAPDSVPTVEAHDWRAERVVAHADALPSPRAKCVVARTNTLPSPRAELSPQKAPKRPSKGTKVGATTEAGVHRAESRRDHRSERDHRSGRDHGSVSQPDPKRA